MSGVKGISSRHRKVMEQMNERLPSARVIRNKVISEVNYGLMKLATIMEIKTKINPLTVNCLFS